jgi:hypothetical protein
MNHDARNKHQIREYCLLRIPYNEQTRANICSTRHETFRRVLNLQISITGCQHHITYIKATDTNSLNAPCCLHMRVKQAVYTILYTCVMKLWNDFPSLFQLQFPLCYILILLLLLLYLWHLVTETFSNYFKLWLWCYTSIHYMLSVTYNLICFEN